MSRWTAALRWCALAMALVSGLGGALRAQESAMTTYMSTEITTVPTPDFKGKTLAQAKAAAVTPSKVKGQPPVQIFRSISTQGPEDGVVASQSPAANVPVVPGRNELTLTLQEPKSSGWGQVIQGILGQKPKLESTVPSVLGDTCDAAMTALKAQRLVGVCSGDAQGVVAQQYPLAGTSAASGSRVTVMLRLPLVVVPVLSDLTVADARGTLAEQRLQLGVVSGGAKGNAALPVVAQSPAAGTSVEVGTAVDVTLETPVAPPPAKPPPPPPLPVQPIPPGPVQQATVVVPYLEKMNRADAANTLASVGLGLGTATGNEAGVVTAQSPGAGTPVAPGSSVDVTLAVPVVQEEVPDMVGQDVSTATARLVILQLKADVQYPQGQARSAAMVVQSQDPAPGTIVEARTSVVLQMGAGTPAPTSLPWTWIGAGALVLLLGGATVPRMIHPRVPSARQAYLTHPVVTTVVRPNASKATITCKKAPAVRFTVTLRDQSAVATYRSEREAEVVGKGVKL